MFRNYLKTSLRSLSRNKIFSFITIFGLAIGLTCCMLILTFVIDEVSYDKFHSRGQDVYRLRYKIQEFDLARVPVIFKDHLDDFFPEIEKSGRFYARSVSIRVDANGEERRFEEPNVHFADPEIAEMFNFELVAGSLEQALTEPFTVILNQEIAEKYFGNENPVGRDLLMEGEHDFRVIAVVKDFPSNSHVHFDMILPFDNMYDLEPEGLRENIRANFQVNWIASHSPTYVLLKDGADPQRVNDRFPAFVDEKIPESMQKEQAFELQPLHDIHLNDEVTAQSEAPGSYSFIYIFTAVGVLTLIIACINFINLSTVKSLKRAREIGMRKVLGALKRNLIAQFLGESFVITMIAALLAIFLTLLLLPEVNSLTNKELSPAVLLHPAVVAGFLGIILLTSLLAGFYPAFFVSRFNSLNSLKEQIKTGKSSITLRKGLILVQLTISMVLIAGTLVVFDQLRLLRTQPLGFEKQLMITAPIQSANLNNAFGGVSADKRKKMNAFEEELAGIPEVAASTASSATPGFGLVNRNVIPEGFTAEDHVITSSLAVDYDFIETYGIQLVEGRGFSQDFGTDHTSAFVINELTAREYKFGTAREALGKTINLEGKEGTVVGVVKDFNVNPLTNPMSPLIMEVSVPQFSVFTIRLSNANTTQTLEKIGEIWNKHFPNETFDPSFLDESLAENYETQEQFGKLIGYFAFMAILISCLGSYGVIMYMASQRRKEIGVRKVLGASIPQIILLLSKQFIFLVGISLLIATPVIYWFSDQWLNDFSYRVDLSPISILMAFLATLGMILITVSQQSVRAALENPADALKEE